MGVSDDMMQAALNTIEAQREEIDDLKAQVEMWRARALKTANAVERRAGNPGDYSHERDGFEILWCTPKEWLWFRPMGAYNESGHS